MNGIAVPILLLFLTFNLRFRFSSADRLLVKMTLVPNATALGAVCLDGSPPAYHFDRGFGAGARNWILQFEGGGWCNDLKSCLERAKTRRGSTRYMNKLAPFNGILSSNSSINPDFYNWNRVKLRYCDGASFAGDAKFDNGKSVLYFRGQRIWEAIVRDLLPKGLGQARKALLGGCSAGGLSAFLHCNNFADVLPRNASVKCLSDAGFFMDEEDISSNRTMRSFYQRLVTLQGVEKNLNSECRRHFNDPKLCIFPQYALRFIRTPFFILNSAYDVFQWNHALVPPSTDLRGLWQRCKNNTVNCNQTQIDILQGQYLLFNLAPKAAGFPNVQINPNGPQLSKEAPVYPFRATCQHLIGFRRDMLVALRYFFKYSKRGGMFINSCFAHCQSETNDTWFADDSPRIHNKTIARTVGDWYFSRGISKEIDCPYPCDKTCHNLISTSSVL